LEKFRTVLHIHAEAAFGELFRHAGFVGRRTVEWNTGEMKRVSEMLPQIPLALASEKDLLFCFVASK